MLSYRQFSGGQKLVILGALLMLACFFAPWITAQYGTDVGTIFEIDYSPVITGWELMTGWTRQIGPSAVQFPGTPSLLVVLLCSLVAFGIVYNAIRRGYANIVDGRVLLCLGVLPLIVLFLIRDSWPSPSAQFGLLGVVIGSGAVVGGAILDLKAIQEQVGDPSPSI